VVGIDDWAWRRGHRYGSIICDLERHRIVDLLADREAATVAAWLARHPSIQIIARDRGAGYRQAATHGCPKAIQVADRWHLMENASAAFLDAVRRSMGAVRKALGGGPVRSHRTDGGATQAAHGLASPCGGERGDPGHGEGRHDDQRHCAKALPRSARHGQESQLSVVSCPATQHRQ
jgi:hypothetical protein